MDTESILMGLFKETLDDFEKQMRDYARQFEKHSTPTRFHNGIQDELDQAFLKMRNNFKNYINSMHFNMVEFDEEWGNIHGFKAMFYAGSDLMLRDFDDKTTQFMCIGCKHDGTLHAISSKLNLDIVTEENFPNLDKAIFKSHLSGAGYTYADNKKNLLDLQSVTDAFLIKNPEEIKDALQLSAVYWVWNFDHIFSFYDKDHLRRNDDNRMPIFHQVLNARISKEFHRYYDAFVEQYIDEDIALQTLYLSKTPYYPSKNSQSSKFQTRRFGGARFYFDENHVSNISGFNLYNFVKSSKTEQIRQNRLGAIASLSSTSLQNTPIFYKKGGGEINEFRFKFWDKIDLGISPFQVIADEVSVSKSTVQRIIRKCKWNIPDDLILQRAGELDKIDPQFWPYSGEENEYFGNIVKIAITYDKAFAKEGRDAVDVIKKWIKDNPKTRKDNGEYSWKTLALKIMHHDIISCVQKNKGNDEIPNDKDIEHYIRHKGIHEVVYSYERRVSNVVDMKSDIKKRLINPIIMLALEDHGYQAADISVLKPISDIVLQNTYNKTLPSEQISASAYWHSPEVDMKRRFQSAVLNGENDYKEWEGLLGNNPYEIEDGIFIHPLNSSTALEDESDAMTSKDSHMRFCIWSYGSNHFTQKYHMMSIRYKDGTRISSLTVSDYFNGGQRMIKFSQNKAIDNTAPCEIGKRIEESLIERINSGEITPPWNAIDEVRADYNVNQTKNSVGYDFRDNTQSQGVYDAYRSVLPKNIVKASGGQFNKLGKALGVDIAVQNFINNFDFSQGGLVKLPTEQVRQNKQQQLRPKVA